MEYEATLLNTLYICVYTHTFTHTYTGDLEFESLDWLSWLFWKTYLVQHNFIKKHLTYTEAYSRKLYSSKQ